MSEFEGQRNAQQIEIIQQNSKIAVLRDISDTRVFLGYVYCQYVTLRLIREYMSQLQILQQGLFC